MFLEVWQGKELRARLLDVWQRKELKEVEEVKEVKEAKEAGRCGFKVKVEDRSSIASWKGGLGCLKVTTHVNTSVKTCQVCTYW